MNRFIIKLCQEDLEVTSLSWLFHKLEFNDIKIHSIQEPLICKWYDYICARDHAFRTKQIAQMQDGQIVYYNNSAYLLTEADNTHEAVDRFWTLLHEQSYKQLMDDVKEKCGYYVGQIVKCGGVEYEIAGISEEPQMILDDGSKLYTFSLKRKVKGGTDWLYVNNLQIDKEDETDAVERKTK